MHSPPPSELTLRLKLPPVSQQARSESKAAFGAALRDVTQEFQFLLSGDVSVSVEWTVSEQARYETDRSPDVDNILKPLLDAIAGPGGILVDDNQVQHVSCHWIDSYAGAEHLVITLRYSPDEWLRKNGLYFVQLSGGLCVPLSHETPIEFQRIVVSRYESALELRNKALAKGIEYYSANYIMPVQRVFHRTRLGAFEVVSHEAFAQSAA